MLSRMAGGDPVKWNQVTVYPRTETTEACIVLPNGAPLWYPQLEFYSTHRTEENAHIPDYKLDYWRYKTRKGWKGIYGAALVENLIQALSRVDMSQALLRIYNRLGLRFRLLEHDAAAFLIVDNSDKFATFEIVKEEMRRAPTWLNDLPLDCEGEMSERYG